MASLLTGATVPEHGWLDPAHVPEDWSQRVTLAETWRTEGWRTVLVSGDPLWQAAWPLGDGFDDKRMVGPDGQPLRRETLLRELVQILETDDPQPLFVMVYLNEALPPWGEIPSGLGWVGPRPPLDPDASEGDGRSLRQSWLEGRLDTQAAERLLLSAADHYDWGLRESDTLMRDALVALEKSRKSLSGVRLVITGDHGFYLGEHEAFGVVPRVWDAGVRVPLLFLDTDAGRRAAVLPSAPVSTAIVPHLLRTGTLPRPTPVPMSWASHWLPGDEGHDMSAMWWGDGVKMMSDKGEIQRYDLSTDPAEETPLRPWQHPQFSRFQQENEAWSIRLAELDEARTP